ncbi:MAG: hypothetical protein M1282_01775 [Chloroflexi bacterium]|nr:hypothetical protein [Chloroflexota bacterium]
MKWSFRKQEPGEITRDPIIGEFFSTEAIENPAEALVREGIQNALDAKTEQTVRVRIFLGNGDQTLKKDQLSLWFDGIWDHVNTKGNGLRDVPTPKDPCPYLVFEDFGTTGLQGDVHQPFDEPGNKNSFFYFFRAEGRSGKGETDRGRWGIGKHVFPRSSRVSTYFGFTVRADDRAHFLMGHTILKSHKMQGNNYAPDGYLGEPSQNNALILPITDSKTLDRFRKDFHLSRKDEPGLSIAVPFVDSDITVQHLKHAAASGYFYPILKAELVVDIDTPNQTSRIDAKTLLSEIGDLETNGKSELISLIGFADWAVHNSSGKEYVLNPCTLDAPVWSDDLIPQEIFENIRHDLDSGKSIAFHVGITVYEKGKKSKLSYFNVYLRQDGFKSGRPVFIREGIIISDIHARTAPGVRSLVVVEDKPLATLLGDSENPAHTQWQKDSSNFRKKYVNGKNYIEFVTRIVSNIVSALAAREKEKDPYLFADIFSLPLDAMNEYDESLLNVHQSKGDKKTGVKRTKINHQKKPFQISKISGGFKVIPSDLPIEPQTKLKILVAYDLRRGNPLQKYLLSDFELGKPPIKYKDSQRGINVLKVEANQILLEVTDTDFQLVVNGFDDKRDLFVKVDEAEEGQND